MSATDELRRLLDERGVEYETNDHLGAYETSWDGFTAMQLTPGAKLMMVFTPEQAIAATLRGGMCHITASSTDGLCSDNPRQYFELSCGHTFTLDGLEPPNYCPNCGAKVIQGVDNAD